MPIPSISMTTTALGRRASGRVTKVGIAPSDARISSSNSFTATLLELFVGTRRREVITRAAYIFVGYSRRACKIAGKTEKRESAQPAMDFRLTEQQVQLQEELSRRLAATCGGRRLHEAIDSDEGYAAVAGAAWEALRDFGAFGCIVPEAYGGAGLEMIDLALIAEALGWAGAPGGLLSHMMAGVAVASGGDEAQKAHWLPKLASGEVKATIALADAENAWPPQDWTAAPQLTKRHVAAAEEGAVVGG